MRKIIMGMGLLALALSFAFNAMAQTKFSVSEMARSSDTIVVAKVLKINKKVEPPQVTVKVTTVYKGKKPKKKNLRISLLADDAGGKDPKAAPFKVGKSYILFIIQIEEDFAFLFQNISGKLLVKNKNWLSAHKKMIKGISAIDKEKNKDKRTRKMKKYLESKSSIVQKWALGEVQIRSSQFNMKWLKKPVEKYVGSKDKDIRKKALMALTRAYDSDAEHGYSQDLKLMKILINALADKEEDIRNFAHQQLRSHTRKSFEYDPKGSVPDRKNKIMLWKAWYKKEKAAKDESGKK